MPQAGQEIHLPSAIIFPHFPCFVKPSPLRFPTAIIVPPQKSLHCPYPSTHAGPCSHFRQYRFAHAHPRPVGGNNSSPKGSPVPQGMGAPQGGLSCPFGAIHLQLSACRLRGPHPHRTSPRQSHLDSSGTRPTVIASAPVPAPRSMAPPLSRLPDPWLWPLLHTPHPPPIPPASPCKRSQNLTHLQGLYKSPLQLLSSLYVSAPVGNAVPGVPSAKGDPVGTPVPGCPDTAGAVSLH